MRYTNRFILIIVVMFLCVGCDQTSKVIAQATLSETETLSFLGDIVRLQLAHNQGAFLSLGASFPEIWRLGVFSIGSGCILLALFIYTLFSNSISQFERFAFAVILAGGVSNVADRIMNNGFVVDFINVGIGYLRTGIFNIADIAITAGTLVLIGGMSRKRLKSH